MMVCEKRLKIMTPEQLGEVLDTLDNLLKSLTGNLYSGILQDEIAAVIKRRDYIYQVRNRIVSMPLSELLDLWFSKHKDLNIDYADWFDGRGPIFESIQDRIIQLHGSIPSKR